jgi:hypothetical protein
MLTRTCQFQPESRSLPFDVGHSIDARENGRVANELGDAKISVDLEFQLTLNFS